MLKVDEFWIRFLKRSGRGPQTSYTDCFYFDLSKEVADRLLRLVLDGKKRATSSALKAFELTNNPAPKVGDLCIITDFDGTPKCVIEITGVMILPFCDITYDICKREGEDDDLESWRESHRKFFTEDGKELGYEFDENMPVVFEDFKVVYSEE